MKYDFEIARGMIEGALFAAAILVLFGCATPRSVGYVGKTYTANVCDGDGAYADCVNALASTQCPNGVNDYDAYRDRRGRLHVYAGCD